MDMRAMMRQAQKMQAELAKAQEEIKTMTFEGSAGGGMVKAVATGEMTIESVKIEKIIVDPDDIEMLEDLIVAATNEALRKVEEETGAAMSKLTGGLGGGIPGMF